MATAFIRLTGIARFLTLVFSAIGVVIVPIGGFMNAGKLGHRAIKQEQITTLA
jgi:hypothetical protein